MARLWSDSDFRSQLTFNLDNVLDLVSRCTANLRMTDVTDFKQTYCESRGIALQAFEKNFLKEVFHTPGKPLALLLLLLRPSVFREELALITHIGSTVEFESFADRRNKLIDHTLYQIAPWRKAVGIRASGRKLFQIGNTVNSAAFRD